MTNKRKHHSADTKQRVAIEALKQHKTTNEITREYGVRSTQERYNHRRLHQSLNYQTPAEVYYKTTAAA